MKGGRMEYFVMKVDSVERGCRPVGLGNGSSWGGGG